MDASPNHDGSRLENREKHGEGQATPSRPRRPDKRRSTATGGESDVRQPLKGHPEDRANKTRETTHDDKENNRERDNTRRQREQQRERHQTFNHPPERKREKTTK